MNRAGKLFTVIGSLMLGVFVGATACHEESCDEPRPFQGGRFVVYESDKRPELVGAEILVHVGQGIAEFSYTLPDGSEWLVEYEIVDGG
ncbi:MAG: hypothetical protein AAF799_25280 [Myxococcota bacterium]